MLDEQFFGNKIFHSYLKDNFVLIHAYKKHPQAGDDLYGILSDHFGIVGTPTVIISDAGANEYDRIVGYGNGQADEFKQQVIDTYESKDNIKNLLKRYKNGTNDLDFLIELSQKLRFHRKFDVRIKIFEAIISDPKAKSKMVPFGQDGSEVSAVKYAEIGITSAKETMKRYSNRK